MFVRLGSFLAMALIAVLALASCGTPDNKVEPTVTRIPNPLNAPVIVTGTTGTSSGAPAPTVASSNPPMTLDIQLEDIKFDKTELTVPANTNVTINIKNSGAATHNFNIDDLNVHSGDVPGGGTASVSFNSGAAGKHEYYCNIPGHKEAGMDGTLTVTANAESAPSGAASPVAPSIQASASPPAGAQGAAPQTTFEVDLQDISFSVKSLDAPANTDITINLKNKGAATHNFNIDDLNVHSGDIPAGGTGIVKFNTGAPGQHQYYCNIPDHKEAGMIGTLNVVTGGGAAPAGSPPAAPVTAASPVAHASPVPAVQTTFEVDLEDISFSVKSLDVPANTQITINLVNKGAATHNFNIDDLNVHSGDVPSGQKAIVTFNSGAAGTHQYYCNIPGHKEAGMVGTLTVK
jgi:plastocyanin